MDQEDPTNTKPSLDSSKNKQIHNKKQTKMIIHLAVHLKTVHAQCLDN